MSRTVEAIVGAVTVGTLAVLIAWPMKSFPVWHKTVTGLSLEPTWIWTYRGLDVVVAVVTVFLAVVGAAALFRIEKEKSEQETSVKGEGSHES